MAQPVSNRAAEKSLREALAGEGFALTEARRHGETGVDIVATKGRTDLYIEVIGYKKKGPERAKDFYQSFFRVVSRINDGAKRCILALPRQFELGLPKRAHHHRVAWRRIGEAFPELHIWLVDVERGGYEKTRWNDWLDKPASGTVMPELLGTVKIGAGRTALIWTRAEGKRLRQLRNRLRLTQAELGRQVNRTGSRMSELERGVISYGRPARPSVELHRALKSFFHRKGLKL